MIRVAIVDDHAIVRAGLRQYFSEQVDLTVVAEAANGREALDIVRKGEVDVHGDGPVDARPERRRRAGRDQGARAGPAGADPERLSRGALRDHAAAPGRERLPQQGVRPRGDRQGDPHRLPRAASTSPPGVAELLADGLGGGRRQAASRAAVGARVPGVPAPGQGRDHRPHGRTACRSASRPSAPTAPA